MIKVRLKYYRERNGYDSSENLTTIHFGRIPVRALGPQMRLDSSAVDENNGMEMEMSTARRETSVDGDSI